MNGTALNPLRRRTSLRLFSYVSGQYLLPLTCCLAAFVLLFVLIDFFDVLQDLIGAKADLGGVTLYFLLRLPANLLRILPMSILLAAGYMMSSFMRHQEITAIRACGVSLIHACLPIWLVGLAFSGLSLWLDEAVAPPCSARAETLFRELTEPAAPRAEKSARLAYRNPRLRRDWFFESFSKDGEQTGVLVKQFRPDHRVLWEIRAARAMYRNGAWTLYDAVRVDYDEDGMLPRTTSDALPQCTLPEASESPGEILNSLRPAEVLTIREMSRLLHHDPYLPRSTRNVLRTTVWYRLVFPFSCLGAALIGVSLSVSPHGGSRLRGFGLAVGLLVAYHVISQLLVLFGKNGMLPPVVAGTLPTVAIAAWGGWDLYRKR